MVMVPVWPTIGPAPIFHHLGRTSKALPCWFSAMVAISVGAMADEGEARRGEGVGRKLRHWGISEGRGNWVMMGMKNRENI